MSLINVQTRHRGMLPVGRSNDELRCAEETEGANCTLPAFDGTRSFDKNSTPPGRSRLQGGHGTGYYARDNDFGTSPRFVRSYFITRKFHITTVPKLSISTIHINNNFIFSVNISCKSVITV